MIILVLATIQLVFLGTISQFPWLWRSLVRLPVLHNWAVKKANSCLTLANQCSPTEPETAIAYYKQAISIQPDWAQPHLDLGNYLTQIHQLPEALASYNQAIALKPDWGAAYFYRGNVFQSQGNYQRALEDYQKAIDLDLDLEEVYLNAANALMNLSDNLAEFEQWEELLLMPSMQRALTLSPCGAELLVRIGNWFAKQGKYERMERSYQKALALKPEWAEGYLDVGISLTQLARFPEAVEKFNQAITLKPDWAVAYFYRGNVQQSRQKYEEAVADYQRAVELGLDAQELYTNFGDASVAWANSLIAQQGLDVAMQKLQQALAVNPNHAAIYMRMGDILAEQGDEEQMLKNYQQAIALQPKDSKIYQQIGRMLERLNRPEEALNYYQTALKLRPDSAELHMSVGGIWLQRNQNQEALGHYQQAIVLHPDWLDTYTQAGIALFLDGQHDRATEIWHQGLEKQQKLAQSHHLDRLGIRFLGSSWLIAIGHIAVIDFYVKMWQLGWIEAQKLFISRADKSVTIANPTFLDYWGRYIQFIDELSNSPVPKQLVPYITDEFWATTLPNQETKIYYRVAAIVQQEWENQQRPPLLNLSENERERGLKYLEELGVPKDAWFVCLHVREGGFHKQWNERYVATRDANIDTYNLAIEAIVERGGWVIRVGDPSMKPIPAKEGVIDYAHSNLKSDWLDIFLCGACRFFIGTNSGLGLVSPTFGVPCVLTNWTPMGVLPYFGEDLFIPKLYWSETEERYLSFAETITPPIGYSQFVKFFTEANIKIVDNTPEEILEVIQEMLDRMEGKLQYTEVEERLQEQYHAVAIQAGAYGGSRIGKEFLAKHISLLDRNLE